MINIILDESGNTTSKGEEGKNGPKSRIMGALIVNQEISLLEKELEDYIKSHNEFSKLNIYNPYRFKYEKLKKLPNSDIIFNLILDFLIVKGCKFYFHPLFRYEYKLPDKICGINSTKYILGCNFDIIGSLILIKRKNNDEMNKTINIYYDKEANSLLECAISLTSSSFNIYPLNIKEKINLNECSEFYNLNINKIHGSNILHICTDIISGIYNDNYSRIFMEQNELYRKILKNKYCYIADGPFT